MNNKIEAVNLSVGYGKRIVVKDIDFCVEEGSITTLIGPNGAGKSTILKSILGQLESKGGCIFLDGQSKENMSRNDLARLMSMVMTKRPRTELMTCFDVVATGRYPYTGSFGKLKDEDVEKINSALDFIGISELRECDFSCISDGQRQLVMVARAIASEPEILILDEPTSFLDIRYKLDILSCIHKLAKQEKVTVIMSLHELDLAKGISDKIITVEGNSIGKIGTPKDIFEGGYIQKLYGINPEYFDEQTGMIRFDWR